MYMFRYVRFWSVSYIAANKRPFQNVIFISYCRVMSELQLNSSQIDELGNWCLKG